MKFRFVLLALGAAIVLLAILFLGNDPSPVPAPAKRTPSGPKPRASDPVSDSKSTPNIADLPVPAPAADPPRETKSLVWRRLARLAAIQNPDGTWGDQLTLLGNQWIDETGLTALVIYTFLQSGSSHLSKEDMDGVNVGEAIKNGIFALMRRQGVDGAFSTSGDPTVNQSLATLALCEAYGMSATTPFKKPAQLAVKALQRRFSYASGWGGEASSLWAAWALGCARYSELEVDGVLADRSMEFSAESLTSGSSPQSALAWSLLRDERHGSVELKSAADLARSRPIGGDLFSSFIDTALIFQQEGDSGDGWKARGREFVKGLPDAEQPAEFTRTDSESTLRLILESFHLILWYWRPPGVVPSKH